MIVPGCCFHYSFVVVSVCFVWCTLTMAGCPENRSCPSCIMHSLIAAAFTGAVGLSSFIAANPLCAFPSTGMALNQDMAYTSHELGVWMSGRIGRDGQEQLDFSTLT